MKNLLLVLSLCFSGSLFANTTMTLACDHVSEDNWPLGGKEILNVTLAVGNNGNILSALVDGEHVVVNEEGSYLIQAPAGDSSVYGETYFYFEDQNLEQVKLGEEVVVEMSANDYLAAFTANLQCVRTR